jgi:hypothetical protein
MRFLALTLLLAASGIAAGQSATPASPVWQMQQSGTTAGLRGIDSVDGTVAWASGTGGTVLRTIDGGAHWTQCATPDAAKDGATLDFRGVQAWDATTAIVMASGPGEKSRLYKTIDGCKTWELIFKNPDKDGFWDAFHFQSFKFEKRQLYSGWLLGDPVRGQFSLFNSEDRGRRWIRQTNKGLSVETGTQSAFAASNSSLFADSGFVYFGTGGAKGAFVYSVVEIEVCLDGSDDDVDKEGRKDKWIHQPVLFGESNNSTGVFSIGVRHDTGNAPGFSNRYKAFVAVGGDYTKPNESAGSAAWSADSGQHWSASTTPPHGFRSAVQWSESLRLWITVGTNGSDISRDDGKTWQPIDDGNWNALSLPFVVGPNGRIARLNPAALASAK